MSKEEGYQSSSLTALRTNKYFNNNHYSMLELAKSRIIQKTVVYVIGLSSVLANKDILMREEYFGQYGHIVKIVVNKNGYAQDSKSEMTYSAYVSFVSPKDASFALLAIDNTEINGHVIRSSYGTTKYCSFFLKNMDCGNKDCLYLHSLAEDEDILFKEDFHSNKMIFLQQQRIAMRIGKIHHKEYQPKQFPRKMSYGFPSIDSLYQQEYSNDANCNYNNTEREFKKYSEYDAYDEENNDFEYVLVKEPSFSKRRKWKMNTAFQQQELLNNNKRESKKRKRNFTLEDMKIQSQQELQDELSSSSSVSTLNSNSNSNQKNNNEALIPKNKSLFTTAVKSRFDFVNDSLSQSQSQSQCQSESIDIPQFFLDIIYKATSSLSFFKQITLNAIDIDLDILIEEANQITSWNNDQ